MTDQEFLKTQIPLLTKLADNSNKMLHFFEKKFDNEPFQSFRRLLFNLSDFDSVAWLLKTKIEKETLTIDEFKRALRGLERTGDILENVVKVGWGLKERKSAFNSWLKSFNVHLVRFIMIVHLILDNLSFFEEEKGMRK